jgi:outer membrane protein TolC
VLPFVVSIAFLLIADIDAPRHLRIAPVQYEQGATSFTTVLTAEQNLLQAQNSLVGASANVPLGLTADQA